MSLPLFVSPVLSPRHLGWLNRLKLDWCHHTPPQVKGSAELSHSAERHQKKPHCCLSCGWVGMWVHNFPKEDMHSRPQCTDSVVQTEQECDFSCLFLEKELSRGTQEQQLLYMEIANVTCPCRGQGRARLFLPASSTPLGKADPNLLVGILLWGSSTLRTN